MKIAKSKRRTKYPKIMKQTIQNVKNGLKLVIGASVMVLFKKRYCTPALSIPWQNTP